LMGGAGPATQPGGRWQRHRLFPRILLPPALEPCRLPSGLVNLTKLRSDVHSRSLFPPSYRTGPWSSRDQRRTPTMTKLQQWRSWLIARHVNPALPAHQCSKQPGVPWIVPVSKQPSYATPSVADCYVPPMIILRRRRPLTWPGAGRRSAGLDWPSLRAVLVEPARPTWSMQRMTCGRTAGIGASNRFWRLLLLWGLTLRSIGILVPDLKYQPRTDHCWTTVMLFFFCNAVKPGF
jgi:hypothetical protein